MKLSWRIQGAAGGLDNSSTITTIANRFAAFTNTFRRHQSGISTHHQTNETNKEFWSALINLNIVMAVCAACLFLQILLLVLNYALGYYNKSGKTVGPVWFYWTAYFWLPLWGPVLALLYLSRSNAQKNGSKYGNNPMGRTLSANGSHNNPLIFEEDEEVGLYRSNTSDLSSRLLAHDVLAAAVTRNSNQTAKSGDSTLQEYPDSRLLRTSEGTDGTSSKQHPELPDVYEGQSVTSCATMTDTVVGDTSNYTPDGSFSYRDTVISQQTGGSALPSEIYYRPGNTIDYSYSHIEAEELISPPGPSSYF